MVRTEVHPSSVPFFSQCWTSFCTFLWSVRDVVVTSVHYCWIPKGRCCSMWWQKPRWIPSLSDDNWTECRVPGTSFLFASCTVPGLGFSSVILNLLKSMGKLLPISAAVELGPIAHL